MGRCRIGLRSCECNIPVAPAAVVGFISVSRLQAFPSRMPVFPGCHSRTRISSCSCHFIFRHTYMAATGACCTKPILSESPALTDLSTPSGSLSLYSYIYTFISQRCGRQRFRCQPPTSDFFIILHALEALHWQLRNRMLSLWHSSRRS